jgi:hypothetical protein
MVAIALVSFLLACSSTRPSPAESLHAEKILSGHVAFVRDVVIMDGDLAGEARLFVLHPTSQPRESVPFVTYQAKCPSDASSIYLVFLNRQRLTYGLRAGEREDDLTDLVASACARLDPDNSFGLNAPH